MIDVTRDEIRHNQVRVYAMAVALAVAVALGRPGASGVIERFINPVLAVLLYVTFLEVPFVRIRRAFANRRFVAAALAMNFLVVPVVAFALTRVLPSNSVVLVSALMVLLTPCIDYVITFTELAGGTAEQITAITPALMLIQLLLLPAYLWLFVGREVATFIEAGPFLEAFLVVVALPLTLAWLPVPMMGATLFVVVASQLPRVQDSIGQVAAVVPMYVAFLVVMPVLGRVAAGLVGLDTGASRALMFTSVTRNSLVILPLALALPAGYELAPAVVVTQTLVELSGMVVLVRVVPAWLVPGEPLGPPEPAVGGET